MIHQTLAPGSSTLRPYKMHALWLGILLLAAGLRILALTADFRFHPDEALFTTFARSAALNGAWMLPGPLDKPPLSIYASALVLTSFASPGANPALPDISTRAGEIAARLPGMIASLLTVALMRPLTRRLHPRDRRIGLAAGLLMAVSPLAVFYSGTAFTDGLMLFFVVLAMTLAAGGRCFSAGLALGLAFATKQQAAMFAPLMGIGWLAYSARTGFNGWGLTRLAVGTLIPVAALFAWDTARAQPQSMMALAAANNDVWRLLRPSEVLPRLIHIVSVSGLYFGLSPFTPIVLIAPPAFVVAETYRKPRHYSTWVDILLLTFLTAYLGLHWLVAFNLYVRYFLPLSVVAALLTARLYSHLKQKHRPWLNVIAASTIFFALMWSLIWSTVHFGLEDRERYTRIDQLAMQLNAEPLGTIIYDPWLGWELGYYMGQWSDKRRVYYPTPSALARGAADQPDPAPRLFIAPVWQEHQRWLDSLSAVGFEVTALAAPEGYAVYRLIPPAFSDG